MDRPCLGDRGATRRLRPRELALPSDVRRIGRWCMVIAQCATRVRSVHGVRQMNEYIDSLARVRVAVIGDLMLDCYLHGEVSRISPEAPVPVMRAHTERPVPGGAANVAA